VNPPGAECIVMMGQICWGLTLPLLLGAAQDDLPANWKTVAPKDGGFSVAMPGAPNKAAKKIATSKGHLEVTLWSVEGRNDTVFVVSFCDFAEAELKKGDIEKRLDQARDGAVSSSRGKLQSEKMVDLTEGKARHPGRDLVIENAGSVIARMRIYLVNRRLYQVMVLGAAPTKEAAIFLDSFRLSK
jgi:hypothetical protein